ncbi:90 kDa surface protein [Trypanosoma cruzi]|uniref:90 kDa surface protein, putative n=1 Tax=Trypanosoma cruzi (strain CL Brener) TaxID=353153 RepID=Q4E466_TRYCC|nr:90 kDa surface protein, putative [Trypanosoma cruzi]EAN99557.1 90 kDa surface protein, putative [Trypanosoma cruzi]RNC43876.1 90 kDa surface protein [Trypanosoma cruzi]|eukprot:XP_821408.1 90 kDa surface protein [Trypanosoma cruzi strain CL Brener]
MLLQIESALFNSDIFEDDVPCFLCRVGSGTTVLLLVRVCREGRGGARAAGDAVCAGDGNVARWQLPGNSLWYDCTDSSTVVGQIICGMGVGNCASEVSQSRTKDGVKDAVITINVDTPTPDILENWWERNVEPKAATVAIVPAKPPEAEPPGSGEHKDSRETSSRPDCESSPAVVENSTDVPPSSLPATPGGAGANSVAGAAATTDPSAAALGALDFAPAGELQGPAHSASAASSPAPESLPDPKPTEGGGHSSHDHPVELQEETAAPPTQLSQTGEDGGAAGGAEEDTAANTTGTVSGEGNATAASMPAPLSSAPTTNALENSVGTDACFHGTHLHALPPLVLAALTYGTLN